MGRWISLAAKKESPEKKKISGKRKTAIKWAVFSALFIYGIVALIGQQDDLASIRNENRMLAEKQSDLLEQKGELVEKEKYVKSEDYVEDIARDQLGMVKDNEIVFYPAEASDGVQATPKPTPEQ